MVIEITDIMWQKVHEYIDNVYESRRKAFSLPFMDVAKQSEVVMPQEILPIADFVTAMLVSSDYRMLRK